MVEGPRYVIIDAPSILGLRNTGVQDLPEALKKAGLMDRLNATFAGRVQPLMHYDPTRDPITHLLNGTSIALFSKDLSKIVNIEMEKKNFPIVLGGDCSILIGVLLGLRRIGRYGLFFVDGHSDFYQPQASTTGEVADMELAFVSGRGPDILSNIDGLKPLMLENDIVVFGYRDAEQSTSYGSHNVRDTGMQVLDLSDVRNLGIIKAASLTVSNLLTSEDLSGFWIHLDADVLNDRIMPAVDYRLGNGGLEFSELSYILKILISSQKAIGMTITIYNPNLDSSGSIARKFVSCIVAGLL
ncbi:arginase family protein [Candidatus Nitrosocosmicus arcticus]|uniref:Putative Arginase n=1 Tax=Candidatus Nitrosocosmicus arcticus TaxID=2035267 RepID=A0A557STQ0_9ARCH|nr:arginase family protein [Candidatus Nitrosocosmicus arcticus]TVP39980.1 putative Arginase [Candidatus Nitrosocosmicus arcticus]